MAGYSVNFTFTFTCMHYYPDIVFVQPTVAFSTQQQLIFLVYDIVSIIHYYTLFSICHFLLLVPIFVSVSFK